ncbi:hypothetical protein EYC84_002854 [Monilinia fructicola]|uniref:Uncharacterized protein n=1 Tax=Monilinia fructicola TaxID=38448 RepID=A0A5M9JPG8_MONFR|nr:hypothetical protein EYC84_002854 [Monilinia fructicola]
MQHNNNIKPHHRQLRRRTQSRLPHQPREMVHKTEPEKKRSSTSIPAYINQSLELVVTRLEYRRLLAELELSELKGFVDDKLRYEYDSTAEILYIPPMPSVRHETFSAKVSRETEAQLVKIANGPKNETSEFASKISTGRSGKVYLREFDSDDDDLELIKDWIEREPDEQFQHEGAVYPGVVFEIASSQSRKSLEKVAWDYIQYSNGSIKVVVGFQLGYDKDLTARCCTWGSFSILRQIIPQSNQDVTHSSLSSFAPSEVVELKEPTPDITITYAQLATFLNQAESMQQVKQLENEETGAKKSTRKTRKRKREATPTELPIKRERQFLEQEKRVERMTTRQDRAFRGRK